MAGFIRRYSFFPGTETITLIEGVVIVDLPPPLSINGVGSGTVCVVGEFADASHAVDTDSSGLLVTKLDPVEIFGSQDLIDKGGGWDPTIGEFGGTLGNGFFAVLNKRFTRLIIAPIDNITPTALSGNTSGGLRFWRHLPTNKSTTNPQPIVPITPGQVVAGLEVVDTAGAVHAKLARTFTFGDDPAFMAGVDGDISPAGLPAATQLFTSVAAQFVVKNVQVGDLLVVGVIGDVTYQGTDAGTYRVTAVAAGTLTIQRLDGSNFTNVNWITSGGGQDVVFRLHAARTADSGAAIAGIHANLASVTGYVEIARNLDAATDILSTANNGAVINIINPVIVPPADNANNWFPLSGFQGAAHPTNNLYSVPTLSPPNLTTNSDFEARYSDAIDACMSDSDPVRAINIMLSARKDTTGDHIIRAKLNVHVNVASSRGLTRTTAVSPNLAIQSLDTVLIDPNDGVPADRSDRVDYCWPGLRTFIPQASGFTIATSDSKTTTDGVLDDTSDGWLCSVMSNIPPEINPGCAISPIRTVMAAVAGFARGTPNLDISSYTAMRAAGIAGPRDDRVSGFIFQSGITTSLLSGEKNIARRRMADFIQDSVAQALVPFSKQLLTNQLKDSMRAAIDAFLLQLKSPDNVAQQRIVDYQVDSVSGNTPASLAAGIFVIIIRVRLLSSADFIVLQTDISESTQIVQQIQP